MFRAAILTA